MTTPDLIRVLLRRWQVVLAVVAVIAVSFAVLNRSGGTYVAETTVVFVIPGSAAVGVFDDRKRDTLVEFAAAVELEVNNGEPPDRLSPSAPLVGAGVSEGHQVVMPNTGGQWQFSFPEPVLSVRVTGTSPESVRETLSSLVEQIDTVTQNRQVGVNGQDVISTERVPAEATVSHVGPSRRTQTRALLILGLVGLGLAGVAAVLTDRFVDRHAGRRSERRRQDGPPGPVLPTPTSQGVDATRRSV